MVCSTKLSLAYSTSRSHGTSSKRPKWWHGITKLFRGGRQKPSEASRRTKNQLIASAIRKFKWARLDGDKVCTHVVPLSVTEKDTVTLFEYLDPEKPPPPLLNTVLLHNKCEWDHVTIRRTRGKLRWWGDEAIILGDLHTVNVEDTTLDPSQHPIIDDKILHPYYTATSKKTTHTLTSNGGWVTVITPT